MSSKEQAEFMRLYEPVHADFERFCRARVYGDMEYGDLINETLLVAYQKFSTLKDEHVFLSFLIGIAIRLLSNAHRKRKPVRLEETHMTNARSSVSATDSQAEVSQLHMALSQIAADQRECLILFELTGMSIKEISALQDVGESAVKQRLRRGRIALRQQLMDRVAQESQL